LDLGTILAREPNGFDKACSQDPVLGVRQRGREATILLVVNGHHEPVQFTLPPCPGGASWSLLIDTNLTEDLDPKRFDVGYQYTVTARSLLLFVLEA